MHALAKNDGRRHLAFETGTKFDATFTHLDEQSAQQDESTKGPHRTKASANAFYNDNRTDLVSLVACSLGQTAGSTLDSIFFYAYHRSENQTRPHIQR